MQLRFEERVGIDADEYVARLNDEKGPYPASFRLRSITSQLDSCQERKTLQGLLFGIGIPPPTKERPVTKQNCGEGPYPSVKELVDASFPVYVFLGSHRLFSYDPEKLNVGVLRARARAAGEGTPKFVGHGALADALDAGGVDFGAAATLVHELTHVWKFLGDPGKALGERAPTNASRRFVDSVLRTLR